MTKVPLRSVIAPVLVVATSCGPSANEVAPGSEDTSVVSTTFTPVTTSTADPSTGDTGAMTTATTSSTTAAGPTSSDATSASMGTASTASVGSTGADCGFDSIFDDGPVIYWRLGEPDGTSAADESPQNQTGTYMGVTLDVPGVAWDGDGAIEFANSTGSFVVLNPVGAFPSTAFTVEFFARSTDNNGAFVSYASSQNANDIYIDDPDGLDMFVAGDQEQTSVDFSDDEWHHVAVTWGSPDGRWRMYVDGVLETEGTNLAPGLMLQPGGALVLGQDQDQIGGGFDGSQSLNGQMDELIIFDQELGLDRIEAHRRAILCL